MNILEKSEQRKFNIFFLKYKNQGERLDRIMYAQFNYSRSSIPAPTRFYLEIKVNYQVIIN